MRTHNGGVTWRQLVEISFPNEDKREVAHQSSYLVHTQNAENRIGNAHIFWYPQSADEFLAEEWYSDEHGKKRLVGIYDNKSPEIVTEFFQDSNELLFYPKTKKIPSGGRLDLVIKYTELQNLNDTTKIDNLPLSLGFVIGKNFESLSQGQPDALNELKFTINLPTGCYWGPDSDTASADVLKQLKESKLTNLDDKDLVIDHKGQLSFRHTVDRCFTEATEKLTLAFKLPISRTAEATQQGIDNAQAQLKNRASSDVVVFVCDMTGSSGMTSNGISSEVFLRFRQVWFDQSANFEMLKVIGDLALVVCTPEQFVKSNLQELASLMRDVRRKGITFRGGLHFGKAEKGVSLDSPIGLARGNEYNGDAINQGCKAGDDKDNKGGLVATAEFAAWFSGLTGYSGFTTGKPQKFGAWETAIHSGIELDDLAGATKRPKNSLGANAPTNIPFPDVLTARASELDSRLIVGLDPDISKFPAELRNAVENGWDQKSIAEAIIEFNRLVIDATQEAAAAFKPQIAFYEQYGIAGLQALEETICLLRSRGLPCILDAKRNDIEHTATAYANAWLSNLEVGSQRGNRWRVDAITINTYLGADGVKPFLDANPQAGLFVLAKTSNPSSADLQDLELSKGGTVYEEVACQVHELGMKERGSSGYSRIGLVVGATYPKVAADLRKIAPHALFLMPGIGAQAGSMDAIKAGAGADGLGAYAAVSRGVLYAFDQKLMHSDGWRERLKEDLNKRALGYRNELRSALK